MLFRSLSEEEDEAGAEEENGAEEVELGAEEGDEEELEDRVVDLESALDELKAEFDALMAGEEHEEEVMPGIHGDEGHEEGDDEFFEAEEIDEAEEDLQEAKEEDEEDEEEVDESIVREYVEKVATPANTEGTKVGATSEKVAVNTKGTVAGKNDMGGTAANIAQSFSTEKGGKQGGLLKPSTQLQDGGNINKPGANAGKTAFKKKEPGHGAEKAGAKESPDNKQSLFRGRR